MFRGHDNELNNMFLVMFSFKLRWKKVRKVSVEMKFIIYCMLFSFCFASTQKEKSSGLSVLCCQNIMIFLESGVVVYESTTIEYPCPEVSNNAIKSTWVVCVSLGCFLFVCCWLCLVAFIIMTIC